MTRRPYRLFFEPGLYEQLRAAPDEVQAAFREILGLLLVNPLPGESLPTARPLERWHPNSYSVVLPGGRGLLHYQVLADQRRVVLISLTWI